MRMRIYAYKLRMRWTLISERYCTLHEKMFLDLFTAQLHEEFNHSNWCFVLQITKHTQMKCVVIVAVGLF